VRELEPTMGKKKGNSNKRNQDEIILLPKAKLQVNQPPAKKTKVDHRILKDPLPRVSCFGTEGCLKEENGDDFQKCLDESYCGFERTNMKDLQLKKGVHACLERLRSEGYFHYDIVQFNDIVNSTRVQRVLVGEPGTTYLYQKLRLFSLPWSDETILDGSLRAIQDLNSDLKVSSKQLIESKRNHDSKHVRHSAGVGSCEFNLTLINAAMVNTSAEVDLQQPFVHFRKDSELGVNIAVNWHRDSTLEPFSTIAVYHHTPDDPQDTTWQIAMNCEQAPTTLVNLHDNDCYYMLGNFNHHHAHAVVAGKTARYASTHRVAVTHNANFDYVHQECTKVLSGFGELTDKSIDAIQVRKIGELCNVLEFDWVRQFFVQGAVHARQHSTWWYPRIEKLETVWKLLEKRLQHMSDCLLQDTRYHSKQSAKTIKMMVYILRTKLDERKQWEKRLAHKHYKDLPDQFRPINRPQVDLRDLEKVIRELNIILLC